MARSTMASLITRLRLLVNDPAGASAQFTDDQLQDWLDVNRVEVRYGQLRAAETYAVGGTITYKVFFANCPNWEADPVIVTATYASAAPSASNLLVGRWEFATDQNGNLPLLISGFAYDLYGAAVMVLESWLGVLKTSVDVSMDGLSKKSSQQIGNLEKLLEQYRQRAGQFTGVAAGGPGSGRWLNTDVNTGSYC